MEKNKEVLKYCPKCKTDSISIFKDQELVQCQNLNCHSLFRKKDYLEFLEFWKKLDHSLDEQYDKLSENGKRLGFISPDTSELFYLDAVAYSFDSEKGMYRGHHSYTEWEDTEKEPDSWTEKISNRKKPNLKFNIIFHFTLFIFFFTIGISALLTFLEYLPINILSSTFLVIFIGDFAIGTLVLRLLIRDISVYFKELRKWKIERNIKEGIN